MSNCVVGSGGLRLPCSIIAEQALRVVIIFRMTATMMTLDFLLASARRLEKALGGIVSACAEGRHVEDITDRHPCGQLLPVWWRSGYG
jgi:hypothetical protein